MSANFPSCPVIVLNPITGEVWDMAPLLQLVHDHYQGRPDMLAEAIYDTNRYLTLVQHTPADTAARLRAVLQLLNALGMAFDSVKVLGLGKN